MAFDGFQYHWVYYSVKPFDGFQYQFTTERFSVPVYYWNRWGKGKFVEHTIHYQRLQVAEGGAFLELEYLNELSVTVTVIALWHTWRMVEQG